MVYIATQRLDKRKRWKIFGLIHFHFTIEADDDDGVMMIIWWG